MFGIAARSNFHRQLLCASLHAANVSMQNLAAVGAALYKMVNAERCLIKERF